MCCRLLQASWPGGRLKLVLRGGASILRWKIWVLLELCRVLQGVSLLLSGTDYDDTYCVDTAVKDEAF